jgi:CMP-N-acetylneuraminic acid synthetase
MPAAPKVSVYLTNHNYGRFIKRAIESVLAQSLQDFELIIIDDGSTDDSCAIIESYIGHPKIIPIFQQNKGLAVTNNIALHKASGRYIMRLDADDWLDEHALELLAGALDRDPTLGLIFPDYYKVDEEGQVIELVRRHDFQEVTLMDQPAHGACTMIRRQCLLDLGGYDETLLCQDGYDLWIRFIEHYKVRNLNLPLFHYRQHGNNLTRNEQRILDTRARIIERHAKSKGAPPEAVAVIPVRGRLFDPTSPALEFLGGRRLIDWTIDAALGARHVRQVLVTTPDPAILDHLASRPDPRLTGVHREAKLAMPNTGFEAALLDALDTSGVCQTTPDAVVALQVESPFRTSDHIDTAVEVMVIFDTDTVIGVRPENDRLFRHSGGGLVLAHQTTQLRLEREELYREAGGLHVARLPYLRQHKSMVGGKVGHVILDQSAALYVRSDWDWQIARTIAAGHAAQAQAQPQRRASSGHSS